MNSNLDLEKQVAVDEEWLANRVLELQKQVAEQQREIASLTNNRDECAAVFKMDRDHELTGPHAECGCPSCNLRGEIEHQKSNYQELERDAKKMLAERDSTIQRLQEALEKIADWKLPDVTDREGNPSSYEVEWGSNGARHYFRQIAREALAAKEGE